VVTLVLVGVGVLVIGGSEPPDEGPITYQGVVTVIDTGDSPVICAGGVAESLPPQCGGIPLDGLDWAQVPWAEFAGGVTWAEMAVTVRHLEKRFELVGTPAEPDTLPEPPPVDFTPPCQPPPGGWVWTDDPRATPEHMQEAIAYAESQPDRSAVWVYSLMDDPMEADETGRQEYVLVALFTGDVETHEAELRSLWGGPLCVAQGTTDSSDLTAIQEELTDLLLEGEVPGVVGFGSSSVDEVAGLVDIGALIIEPDARAWAADRYGEGAVRFTSTLSPTA
jgi:hypothetical protein